MGPVGRTVDLINTPSTPQPLNKVYLLLNLKKFQENITAWVFPGADTAVFRGIHGYPEKHWHESFPYSVEPIT